MRIWFLLLLMLFSTASVARADGVSEQYAWLLQQAAQGKTESAIEALRMQAGQLPESDIWHDRMLVAAALLEMRLHEQGALPAENRAMTLQQQLVQRFIRQHPMPEKVATWPVVTLAAILPGSGHAWLGRWHDAWVVAMLVWPMLLLTLWAARRRMGPVTVFFGMITLWLWSGSVYSAMSLHERTMLDSYMSWWQQLWLASGLPGHPW